MPAALAGRQLGGYCALRSPIVVYAASGYIDGVDVIPHQPRIRHEFQRRNLRIFQAHRLPGGYARLVLTGNLEGFTSPGPGDHAKLTIEGDVGRFYTPMPHEDGVAIDIYLHPHGPLACWASAMPVDDPVILAGPRGSKLVPENMTKLVLVGDCSSYPALARWLTQTDVPTEVILHGDGSEYLDELIDADRMTVHRLDFALDGAELLDIVRGLQLNDETFVWAAGEATSLVAVRRYLRHEAGLDRRQIAISGYWKQGQSNRDHHAPVDESDPDD